MRPLPLRDFLTAFSNSERTFRLSTPPVLIPGSINPKLDALVIMEETLRGDAVIG